MSKYLVFAIVGIFSGFFCAISDFLYNFKGKGNKKLGKTGSIDSNWEKMKEWRFSLSLVFSLLGLVCNVFGFIALFNLIEKYNSVLGYITFILGICGSIGMFGVQASLSIQPVVAKEIMKHDKTNGLEVADQTLDKVGTVLTPTYVLAFLTYIASVVAVLCAIWMNEIKISSWFTILNPFVFMLIGFILKLCLPKQCSDLPFIICNSLGMSMLSLFAILALA